MGAPKPKPPLSYEAQIDKLVEHNLIITDRDTARDMLKMVNYYRFTGYLVPFRLYPNCSKLNRDYAVTLERIIEIYEFDRELRNFLLRYLEIVEVYFRSLIAYELSIELCKTAPHMQHYDPNNYSDPSNVQKIFDKIKQQVDEGRYKDSPVIKHYDEVNQGQVQYPVWVFVEMLSFTDLSKYYMCLPVNVKEAIADKLSSGVPMTENTLHCLSVFRNRCAHAGRLYGAKTTSPPPRFNDNTKEHRKDLDTNSLFAFIVALGRALPSADYKTKYVMEFDDLIQKYKDSIDIKLMKVPDDYVKFLNKHIKLESNLELKARALQRELNRYCEDIEACDNARIDFFRKRINQWSRIINVLLYVVAVLIGGGIVQWIDSHTQYAHTMVLWIGAIIILVLGVVLGFLYNLLEPLSHKIASFLLHGSIPPEYLDRVLKAPLTTLDKADVTGQ